MVRTTKSLSAHTGKQSLDIDRALNLIEKAVEPNLKAAMFELAKLDYATPFEQLITTPDRL
jgi:hypothetical protein